MNNLIIEKDFATRAFYGVSFTPESRGNRFIADYETINNNIINLCKQYDVAPARFLEKHYKLATAYLASESRCASAFVVGPAKFPIARMEKRANNSYNHLERLVYFRENIEKTLKKITRRTETQDDKKAKWIKQVETLKAYHEKMKKVNSLLRKKDIAALVALVGQKDADILQQPDFLGRVGYPDYKLTNNLATIKRLEEQIRQIDNIREKDITGFSFDGGNVEFDKEEIRYNIFFDEKPNEEIRTKLKSHGFKWSPRRGAWTRGAKTISIKTVENILKG